MTSVQEVCTLMTEIQSLQKKRPRREKMQTNSGKRLSEVVSAAPQQSEICVNLSVFHTVFDVKFR